MDEDDFNIQLQASFGSCLGGLGVKSPRLKWPLRPVYVPKRVAPGFVLAGDAAHTLHPLAGMGYNLALGDAAILLDCLQQAHKRGLPAGHLFGNRGLSKTPANRNSCPDRHYPASGSCPFPAKWDSHHDGGNRDGRIWKNCLAPSYSRYCHGGKIIACPAFFRQALCLMPGLKQL